MTETINVYQWGTSPTDTIENPFVETMESFLNRHSYIRNKNKEGVIAFLVGYRNVNETRLKFFVGTQTEFEKYKENLPTVTKADKGQEALVAIEFNDSIKGFLEEKRDREQITFNNNIITQFDTVTPQDYKDKALSNAVKARGELTHISQYLSAVHKYEMSVAINTNKDSAHQIQFIDRATYILVLKMIQKDNPTLYTNINTLMGFEKMYEPEVIIDEIIRIQQALHPQPAIDPNARPGGSETLAGQMPTSAGGTQGGK